MAYTKTTWQDRLVEFPNRFTLVDNGDGTFTLTPAPGTVTQVGTPLSASNMNKIEQGIADALPASAYTAADVLAKLKTVDGAGSGLDADMLDGYDLTQIFTNDYRGSVGTDANALDRPGVYYVSGSSGVQNAPNNLDGMVYVASSHPNWVTQIFVSWTGKAFYRVKNNGTWWAWSEYWNRNDLRWNAAGYLEYNDGGVWKAVSALFSTKYKGSFSTQSTTDVTALSINGVGRLVSVRIQGNGNNGTTGTCTITIDGVTMVTAGNATSALEYVAQFGVASGQAVEVDLSFKSSLAITLRTSNSITPVTVEWIYELM